MSHVYPLVLSSVAWSRTGGNPAGQFVCACAGVLPRCSAYAGQTDVDWARRFVPGPRQDVRAPTPRRRTAAAPVARILLT